MTEISSEEIVEASPERIWSILTDFPRFPAWNPFILSISGTPEAGSRLHVKIKPPGGSAMTFNPVVLKAEKGRELRWRGSLILPGIFDGEHVFRIEQIAPGRSRFIQSERFSGILVGLFGKMENTKKGFEQMNKALKALAETS